MGEEIVARSWGELTELLFQGAWSDPLRRFRSPYAFRGNSDVGHHLETALSRLGASAAAIEGHLLRNFRKYAFGTIPGDDTTWNWLALAQHHGLPTRLLDWSFSPYVALHFATARRALPPGRRGLDGELRGDQPPAARRAEGAAAR